MRAEGKGIVLRTRRIFLRAVGAAVAGTALAACTGPLTPEPSKVYRVGWLAGSTETETAAYVDAFRAAMRDLGYVEGRNMTVGARYADGYNDRLPTLAAELVALKPDILVAQVFPEILALKQATTAIPIVMAGVADPVESGLIANLAFPGGNITGAARSSLGLTQRKLQLLKEAAPGSSRVAYLYEPTASPQIFQLQEMRAAAPPLGIEVLAFQVRSPDELTSAFAAVMLAHPDAMYTNAGPLARSRLARIVDFAAANRLPTIYSGREFVDAGGLMWYGEDLTDVLRRSAAYVDKVLKGAKPADLPVELSSKFDLIINMKTAKALGLTIPPSVLAQATELIQ